jgi:broad specificity polyphosphatase/5'/3'-nucleotidase SurE
MATDKVYNLKFGSYVVRDAAGVVDQLATEEKFQTELASWLENVEAQTVLISAAVHQVFDTHKGANINMPALVSLAMAGMNVNLANYTELSEKVHEFVQAGKDTVWHIAKGKGGGVRKIADMSAEELAKVAEAKAAKAE